jgi:DeoR/GlpR family transcriptional regulator of sugar metabolism
MSLCAGSGPRLIAVGGEYRRLSQTLVGSLTDPMIDQLHVDTAFMGTIGLSQGKGMTTTDPREAHTKELMMSHARQVVLLADSSKIDKVSFVRVGKLDDVDILITDKGAPQKDLRPFRKYGIKIITA